jgi:hypothetical protein
MIDWALGCAKTRAGSVKMARKGSTAPMLKISAKEARIIKTSSSPN